MIINKVTRKYESVDKVDMEIVLNPAVVNAVMLWKNDVNKRSAKALLVMLGSKKNNITVPDSIKRHVAQSIIFDVKVMGLFSFILLFQIS